MNELNSGNIIRRGRPSMGTRAMKHTVSVKLSDDLLVKLSKHLQSGESLPCTLRRLAIEKLVELESEGKGAVGRPLRYMEPEYPKRCPCEGCDVVAYDFQETCTKFGWRARHRAGGSVYQVQSRCRYHRSRKYLQLEKDVKAREVKGVTRDFLKWLQATGPVL